MTIHVGQLNSISGIVVSHETKGSILFTWQPPFSLNLTHSEPDVAYCIEIYNKTCEMKHHLLDDCDVFVPRYELSVNRSLDLYEILITPRSNTVSGMNGTLLRYTGKLFCITICHFTL